MTFSLAIFIGGFPSAGVSFGQAAANYTSVFWIGILLSYPVGIIPALLSGLLVGIGQLVLGSFGFWHAVAIGSILGLVLFLGLLWDSRLGGDRFLHAAAFFLTMLLPTLGCWLITRHLPTR
jgi:hypothetical protein